MAKFIVGAIVVAVIAAGLFWPVFQPVRESNCGAREQSGLGQASVDPSEEISAAASSNIGDDTSEDESNSWPSDVAGLIDHLNQWDTDELVVYNQPELFPRHVASGETGGWITAHLERLKILGADVRWDKQLKRYVVQE